jgi:hypothetical protein
MAFFHKGRAQNRGASEYSIFMTKWERTHVFARITNSRDRLMCNYSITPEPFMDPESSLSLSQSPQFVPIYARSIQPMPTHPTSPRSILMLSTHLRNVFLSSLFPSGFPTNIYLHSIRATCLAHLILLDLIILIILGEKYKL